MDDSLKECGNCRKWKADKPEHLCLEGKCFADPENPMARTRHCSCEDNHIAIEGEFGE